MIYTFISRACSDLPVAACCRAMKVSTSGYHSWLAKPVSDRDLNDAVLTNTIVDIHRMSRRSYGSPRVHAELRLGFGTRCSRKRVERLSARPKWPASTGVEGVAAPSATAATRPMTS